MIRTDYEVLHNLMYDAPSSGTPGRRTYDQVGHPGRR